MNNPDLLLCAIHAALWAAFAGAWLILGRGNRARVQAAQTAASQQYTTPLAWSVLLFHVAGFIVVETGVAIAVFPRHVPEWFRGQRIVGAVLMIGGAALMAWGIASFRSWRFCAKLDHGHELTTRGAFRVVRHPIYAGVNLIALGSAVWAPTILIWLGFVLVIAGSDLRARTEETILRRAFGTRYTDYARTTKRFLPGLY